MLAALALAFQVSVSTEPGGQLLTFPSAVKSRFEPNNTVYAHLSVPQGTGPHPAILVLPVMAAPNVWIETRFIHKLRDAGFAVMWLEMPYQFHRRPLALVPSGQVFLARTARGLAGNFRQSIGDARRALEVLKADERIDASRIGLFGISLGAIVGSAVYSMDPAPSYGVFMMGGADFPSLLLASAMTGPIAKRLGIKEAEVRKEWSGFDPLDFREGNRGKPALLINVRSDTTIPRANALKLKDAFPDAKQLWLPLGHYTAILHLVWIPRYVARVFTENLSHRKNKANPASTP